MIFQILFFIIFGALGVVGSLMPGYGDVPLLLPFGLDPIFVTVMNYAKGAVETVPYLGVVFLCFGIGIAFELAMIFLKLFLGSRAPGHNIN